MKPLFVSSLYHPHQTGGAEKVVRIIAEGLRAQGHEPVVVTTQPAPGERIERIEGVKVHYLGLKNLYWPWSRREHSALARGLWHAIDRHNALMARAVARVLDAERPDIVNTHNLTGLSGAVWGVVKSRGLPLVHTLHDYSLMCPRTSMFKDGHNCQAQCTTCRAYTAPAKRLSAQVDQVVGVSRFTLQRHLGAGYFRGAQSRVIHNALPGEPRTQARPGEGAGPLRLGYVGQLHPTKGIAQLVQQMRAWRSAQCQLLVAGKGPEAFEAMLREQAPGNVRFLGFVDPAEVYDAIDLLVVPSLWEEPFATTVLEAFMQGLPVIAARRGGLPEAVEPGRTGLLYEPLQPNGLRQAVDAVLRDPGLLQRMRAHVLERSPYFQLERMRAEYLHLLADARSAHAGHGHSPLRRSAA